jgi:ribonuclease BN (tRNA processing enzyme)
MRVIFLGTGGYHPNERRHTAGVLVPELGLAFDAGTSAFRLAERVRGRDLRIFLTHAHLDHICGLTYLLVPLLQQELRSCQVYGLPKTLAAVDEHLFARRVFPVRPQFELVPLPDVVPLDGAVLTWVMLDQHPGGSVGYRVDWAAGPSLAYITDTYADGSYQDFIRGVDVLIHECYFPDSKREWCAQTGHSHTSQVAQLARDSGVGRLFLTHIDPRQPGEDPVGLDAARQIFPRTWLAEDLMEIEV